MSLPIKKLPGKNRFLIFIFLLIFQFQLIIVPEWNTWTGKRDDISLWGYNYMFMVKSTSSIKGKEYQKKRIYQKKRFGVLVVPGYSSKKKK